MHNKDKMLRLCYNFYKIFIKKILVTFREMLYHKAEKPETDEHVSGGREHTRPPLLRGGRVHNCGYHIGKGLYDGI